MMKVGQTTWYVIVIGLLLMVVFALIPSTGQTFVIVALVTPLVGGFATAIELLVKRQSGSGISLLFALMLIMVTVVVSLLMRGH